jgi:hypothetical protein
MRLACVVRLIVTVAILTMVPLTGRTQTSDVPPEIQRAMEVVKTGDLTEALALSEGVLLRAPDDPYGLFWSAFTNSRLGNADAARGRLERLVKMSGNYFAAWELMAQVTQAQGDLPRRDEAIARAKIAISTALDPNIRRKSDFIRDRIMVGGKEMNMVDYFGRGGSDFTRYQLYWGDPRTTPDTGLVLRTDGATTEAWSDTALLPKDAQLFHLDLIDRLPDGGQKVAIYEYYVDEPGYDVMRAKVMQVLRGEARPLTGEPGSLQGILK